MRACADLAFGDLSWGDPTKMVDGKYRAGEASEPSQTASTATARPATTTTTRHKACHATTTATPKANHKLKRSGAGKGE